MPAHNRSVLVTGAGGFIGGHLTRALAARGDQVAGLGHGLLTARDQQASGIAHWVSGDVDFANLSALAERAGGFRAIWHLAGGSSVGPSIAQPFEDFQRSVGAAARLMEWVRLSAPDCAVVLVSSAAVYGSHAPAPVAESWHGQPVSPYGVHKLAAESEARLYAAQYGCKVAIARLFSVYGPGLRKQLLWDLCARIAAGENPLMLGGTGQEQRDFLHVSDAVRLLMHLEAAAGPDGPVVNGGSGQAIAINRVAALVAAQFAPPPEIRFSGKARAGDPPVLHADIAAARALGITPAMPIDQGIADYVRWFRADHR